MLFRKKIERSCSYCVCSAVISGDQVLCSKRGVVSAYYACRKFTYDPCKRVPPKPKALDVNKFTEEDYQL